MSNSSIEHATLSFSCPTPRIAVHSLYRRGYRRLHRSMQQKNVGERMRSMLRLLVKATNGSFSLLAEVCRREPFTPPWRKLYNTKSFGARSEASATSQASSGTMQAMVLDRPGLPLRLAVVPVPEPGPLQLRVRVSACAVCRTDLHVVDGDLSDPKLPIIPGHEIVGTVDKHGAGLEAPPLHIGMRVGIPWLGRTCGSCCFCQRGEENLCDKPGFTGYQLDGGYAEYTVARADYCFPIPDGYSDVKAAPLLCAGLIGFRSFRKAGIRIGDGLQRKIGIYGFGAAAHILSQVAVWAGHSVYAFTRPGDVEAQAFALRQGAVWAGSSQEPPPVELDVAIVFAPVGALIPTALSHVRKGGVVVAGGIHMSDIPSFPYSLLWGERQVVSVANLTKEDAKDFLAIASRLPIQTETTTYPLEEANNALKALREGKLNGAAVLVMPS